MQKPDHWQMWPNILNIENIESFYLSIFGVTQKVPIFLCLKNGTALVCFNFDIHRPFLIIFGKNVAKELSSEMVFYFLTSPN